MTANETAAALREKAEYDAAQAAKNDEADLKTKAEALKDSLKVDLGVNPTTAAQRDSRLMRLERIVMFLLRRELTR
jgi:hypothetical protein